MRTAYPQHQKSSGLTRLLCLGALFLAGCATTDRPETPATPDSISTAPEIQPVEQLQLPASEFSALFLQAEQQLLDFDWMAANHTLSGIDPELATTSDLQYLAYLRARVSYILGDQEQALEQIQFGDSPVHPAIASRTNNFHRHALRTSGAWLESARLGVSMLSNAPTEYRRGIETSIWHDLQSASPEQIRRTLETAQNSDWRAWLALAAAVAESPGKALLKRELIKWQLEHSQEGVLAPLPGGLQHLLDEPAAFNKVAILLPLSDRLAPAAKAIRDGYLTSYYADMATGNSSQQLIILDLDRYESVQQAYYEAQAEGVSLIVGPLNKLDVTALANEVGRPIPVLALNRTDREIPASATALVQLSLAAEDEAEQLASVAFGDGARNAVILRPLGNWGAKMESALSSRWRALGGKITARNTYSGQEDYSSAMASAFNLPLSEQRSSTVSKILQSPVEFTPRRRQDPDVVFLLARNSAEARSLKPLLAYHYAANLPVYSTSSIYKGSKDLRDKDLNGIQLLEAPGILESTSSAQDNRKTDKFARLRALGSDAYLLQSRFHQLSDGPAVSIRGTTGLLTLDPKLRIKRQLKSATFDRGVIKPL